jgi:hypothetical protein
MNAELQCLAGPSHFHQNVTAHPTVEWTLQQFREALLGEHWYRVPDLRIGTASSRGVRQGRDESRRESSSKFLAGTDGKLYL